MKNRKCLKLNLIRGINQEVSIMEHGGHFSSTNIARYFNRHKGERDEKDPGEFSGQASGLVGNVHIVEEYSSPHGIEGHGCHSLI